MEEWLSEIVSFVAGLAGGFSLKIVIDRRRISTATNTDTTTQTGNVAGGDIVGRDKSGPA